MKIYDELDSAMEILFGSTTAKTVEPYNDQYRNTETDHAKAYPAVYFEMLEPINWTQGGNQFQQAKMQARLHVVVYDLTTTKTKLNAFSQEVFLKAHQVVLADADGNQLTSEWVRIRSSLQKRYKNLKVMQIDFEFEGFDYSTLPTNLSGPVSFNVIIPQP